MPLTEWAETGRVNSVFQFNPSSKNEGNWAQGNDISYTAQKTKCREDRT